MIGIDEGIRERYLASVTVPKLHIGGGPRHLDGWLNADIALLPGVLQMDATRPFPFADGTFDYVFTEHMIEHIPFEAAIWMLRECHRVLKSGGIIRVTTPNLAAIVGLYGNNQTQRQQDYLHWFCQTFLPDRPITPANAINAMFRQWGHQFVYDEGTLSSALSVAGFAGACRYELMQSGHQELTNLENVGRYPAGLLDFESIALEARR